MKSNTFLYIIIFTLGGFIRKEKIKEIRNFLVSKLESYTGKPVKLEELGIDKRKKL
ncbi:MAG: hypothetical protein II119_03690 [Bacilli bacterium]|nr:hypothetical protein [Bacilli bacterium]